MNWKLLALDFDGVLTDNMVYTCSDGTEFVGGSKLDSVGIWRLRSFTDVGIIVITNEKSTVVDHRCHKLQLDFYKVDDKVWCLENYCIDEGIDLEDVVYVGNDVNDASCLHLVGQAFCPKDSHKSIKDMDGMIVTKAEGGKGCVREVIEWIIKQCP